MSFKDKVVIVTGSSRGIGASIAISFAKEGADVVVIGRNEDKLKNVEKSCTEAGKAPLVINAELSKDSELKRIINETVEKYGKIDVLINNAGIVRYADLVNEECLSVFDEMHNANVRPVLHLMHLASPYLIASKGNIVNISSISGSVYMSMKSLVPYSITKAAVNHMTTCVAGELAKYGVRVNAISPGPVKTDINKESGMSPEEEEELWGKISASIALKRISDSVEIANMCLYLASDKAVGITGSNFVVDCGTLLSSFK